MDVATKAKVMAIKSGRAAVEVKGKKRFVDIRDDVEVKPGDIVIVAFNAIVDKVK